MKTTNKILMLSMLFITVCIKSFSQGYIPQAGMVGYTNYLAQNPLASNPLYNQRMAATLRLIINDLDSTANRANKGGATNVTNNYIPVASGIALVNSKMYQSGLAVKLIPGAYVSGPDTNYIFGFSKGGDTILFSGVRSLFYAKKDSASFGAVGKIASHLSRVVVDSNHVQIISQDGKVILKDRTNTFKDTLLLNNLTANRSDSLPDGSGTIPVAQRLARGTLTNTNGAYSWAPIGLRTYQAGVPFDSTGTITAAKLAVGYITSTSAAGVTLTTPTATALATALGSIGARTVFTFVVDNSAGSNIVTVALDASIVANTVITGGNTLTVATGKIGVFQMVFTSTSAAQIGRIQ